MTKKAVIPECLYRGSTVFPTEDLNLDSRLRGNDAFRDSPKWVQFKELMHQIDDNVTAENTVLKTYHRLGVLCENPC